MERHRVSYGIALDTQWDPMKDLMGHPIGFIFIRWSCLLVLMRISLNRLFSWTGIPSNTQSHTACPWKSVTSREISSIIFGGPECCGKTQSSPLSHCDSPYYIYLAYIVVTWDPTWNVRHKTLYPWYVYFTPFLRWYLIASFFFVGFCD